MYDPTCALFVLGKKKKKKKNFCTCTNTRVSMYDFIQISPYMTTILGRKYPV